MKIKMSFLSLLMMAQHTHASFLDDRGEVMLAKPYRADAHLTFSQYWMSEKLDGIRGIWDGHALTTRSGVTLNAPQWFYQFLPPFPVEGELWAGRGNFHLVQQTILDHTPNEAAWQSISLMLFDIPFGMGNYQARYETIKKWLSAQHGNPHLKLIQQYPVISQQHLDAFMTQVIQNSGEGVMLKKRQSAYQSGRSYDLLKLKPYIDEEAQVIGYKPGKGKYRQKVGALFVRNQQGVEFYVSSGLTDEQRVSPPPIGAWITYRYDRLTHHGKPRFARLVRERLY